jgi:osmotically-inducible protein OsmY
LSQQRATRGERVDSSWNPHGSEAQRGVTMRRTAKMGLVLGLTAAVGCNAQDADRLQRIAGHVATRLDVVSDHAAEKARASWDAARGCWTDSALDGRVRTRLAWDKELADLKLVVHSNKTNDVRLRGTIRDEAQHQRILELTRATQGVNQIVDELKIEEAQAP